MFFIGHFKEFLYQLLEIDTSSEYDLIFQGIS